MRDRYIASCSLGHVIMYGLRNIRSIGCSRQGDSHDVA